MQTDYSIEYVFFSLRIGHAGGKCYAGQCRPHIKNFDMENKKKIIENEIIEFVKSKKDKYINYNHWISGSSTVVYPIMVWHDDDRHTTINFQMGDCDARNWRGFENVLKKNFSAVKDAYYCRYDGSCPDEYRIIVEFQPAC